ncbi:MAG: MlaD family protein [Mariniphaga sp.]
MNESPNKHAVIVGLFIFIGISFLLAGILIVGNLRETFNRKMGIVSFFDDVNGLQPGNNVWFSGLKIGTVKSLEFFGKSQVEVSLNIQSKAQKYIRKDAKVKISNDGLIGNKILVIYGGTDDFPEIEAGDTLSVEKTFSSEDMVNTFQENNNNLLAITANMKTITNKLAAGEGTIGKLLNDSSLYLSISLASKSLEGASLKANELMGSLATYGSGLNKKGTLANELTTDTIVFKSIKASVMTLHQITDTASVMISMLKQAGSNHKTALGVLLYNEETGTQLKETMKNAESSSIKLDDDLEAVQHNFLLRNFFRKKAKYAKQNSEAK